MKSLKKISNYLLMVGGILTALSGIVNTTMDIVGNFKKEDKKEEVSGAPAPVMFEQRVQGAPGVRISKTVDMPAASVAAPVEPPQPITQAELKETKNTLWWVIATIVGSFVASVCWYIHSRLSILVEKKD